MKFTIEITTDSKDKTIKDKCLEAVTEVLEQDGSYFGVGYAVEQPITVLVNNIELDVYPTEDC